MHAGPGRLIVNADDLGYSISTNEAIRRAFEQGWISSSTLMANMPAFEAACDLVLARGWMGRIGVHLNLSQGPPITPAMRQCPRFCGPDGNFLGRGHCFSLTAEQRLAVEGELGAQIERCLERGIRPSHLDSHHHYHTEWAVGTIVIRLARRFAIPAVRLSRNLGPSPGLVKNVYKSVFNTRLRASGLAKTLYFGEPADLAPRLAQLRADAEVMVHPRLDAAGEVRDFEDGPLLKEHVAPLGDPARWISYGSFAS